MMEPSLEHILNDCIDALIAGESVDEVLARYPDKAATLRPLLNTAASLFELATDPPPEAKIASRRAFLQRAATTRPRFMIWPRFATLAVGILLAISLLGSGLSWAANTSLPGDPLYGVKRAVEQVQLTFGRDNQQLKRSLEERRRNEVLALLERRRKETVEFRGVIEQIDSERWSVSGIPVIIDTSTQMQGELLPGTVVTILGRTTDEGVQATVVVVEPDKEGNNILPFLPTISPTATSSSTVAPPMTPSLSSTATVTTPLPTANPAPLSPTPTDDDEEEGAPHSSPTATSPLPSPSPTPDDDDEEEGDNDGHGAQSPSPASTIIPSSPSPTPNDGNEGDNDDQSSPPPTATMTPPSPSPTATMTPTPPGDDEDDDNEDDN